MASSYMLQAIVGLVVSLSMYFLADYFYAAGLILPMDSGKVSEVRLAGAVTTRRITDLKAERLSVCQSLQSDLLS